MLPRMLAALVLLLAACPSSPKPPPPGPGPGPAPAGSATSEPAPAGPKLGEPCGADDACGEGTCVSYRGIAGARGPEFKSCEIRCAGTDGCTGGRKCVTVADGPGQVCR